MKAITFDALRDVLVRLRSKSNNPDQWYLGWNAALDCLIHDIDAQANTGDKMTASSNEAKTPLANVSDSKDNLLNFAHVDHPHVSRNPDIYGGAPIVSGIRFTVSNVLGYLATNHDIKSICETWNLTEDAVRDAIGFAQDVYNEAIYGREQPSTSGVFSNPERGTIARNETESASSISSTLAEIRERWLPGRKSDIDTLLGIIDEWESHREGLIEAITTAENAAESAASNMKAAILQRVRERAEILREIAEAAEGHVHAEEIELCESLATELESIQLKDEDQNEG